MKVLPIVFGLGLACCSLCIGAYGADLPKDTTTISIDAAAVQQDPRLTKPVSVSLRNAPLKEVLDRFTEQTGVDVSIDGLDPASGYSVFVQCDKAPVNRMMNALYGVLSIQHGEWAWVRTGKPSAYHYSLHETPWAKDRTAVYNRILNGILTNFAAVMRDLAPMKMDERKMHSDAIRKALFLDSDVTLGGFVDDGDKGWIWYQASFFFNSLSREQQDSVLAGEKVSVDLKSLPPDVYNAYHQSYLLSNASYTDPSGKTAAVPEADVVQFFRKDPNLPAGEIAPMIMLEAGAGAGSWMGTGWFQAGIPSAIKRAWMLQGDSATDAAIHTVVREVKDSDEIRKDKDLTDATIDRINRTTGARMSQEGRDRRVASMRAGLSLESRLEQLSFGGSVPVVAILPPNNPRVTSNADRFNSPVGKTIQDFLNHLETNVKRHMYKWRDGVLLIGYPLWFAQQSDGSCQYQRYNLV